jgi:hypothetical protein
MWKNILFGRSGGYYLFYASFIYLLAGAYNVFVYHFAPVELIQMVWISVMALPFAVPPVGRYFNMNVTWDRDWFQKKETVVNDSELPENVVQFPEPKLVPPMPQVQPPKEPEKPVSTYYRLGITNNSRVSFQMGYSEITMNAEGIDNMIKQLEVFRDQIREYEEYDNE